MVIQDSLGWNSDDSLYIVTDCESLSPVDSVIYIFQVMSDYSECVDGMKYLVRHIAADMDTVVSYVDTLFRILLPSPLEYYSDTSTVGHPGQVLVPGVTSYSSILDANRISLLTDYGDHYVVPRFSFNQTGDQTVFFSKYDAIDIKSFITFRLANTGVFGPKENDIVILKPNGFENLFAGDDYKIRWRTYGAIETVDVFLVIGEKKLDVTKDEWKKEHPNEPLPDDFPIDGKSPNYPHWKVIDAGSDGKGITNNDEYPWIWENFNDATNLYSSDSVRIIIKDSDKNSEVYDVSGWYSIVSRGGLLGRTSMGSAVINRGKLTRPGKSR